MARGRGLAWSYSPFGQSEQIWAENGKLSWLSPCSVTECWKPERRGWNWLEVTSACCVQAVDSRDSMAMALYSQCFNWIICRLNSRIRGKEDFKSISILDIFGFENFEVSLRREIHRRRKNPRLLNEGLLDLTESIKSCSHAPLDSTDHLFFLLT